MLYVVTAPDPAAGTDFELVVPGNYLYDVTGITATLTTQGSVDPVDVSGHGNDGTYQANVPAFVPGKLAGDDAARFDSGGPGVSTPRTILDLPDTALDVTGSISGCFWYLSPSYGGIAPGFLLSFRNPSNVTRLEFIARQVAGTAYAFALSGTNYLFEHDNITIPADDTFHLYGFTYNAVTHNGAIYVDGAAQALTTNIPGGPEAAASYFISLGRNNNGSGPRNIGTFDELALFNAPLTAAQHAAIFAAGAGSFAAYTATVLGLGPETYYHLDMSGGTGRQPSLVITNGTNELEAIPSGFPAVTTPGPYEYAWQPALNADSQSSDGTLTTVACPPLILPAGYTVGTRTLDLAGTDQWSAVTLWWNDDYQNAIGDASDYSFPGGVLLRYLRTEVPV